MEVDGDLLLVEDEVHHEQVVQGHERGGVKEATRIQESLEVLVRDVRRVVLLKL